MIDSFLYNRSTGLCLDLDTDPDKIIWMIDSFLYNRSTGLCLDLDTDLDKIIWMIDSFLYNRSTSVPGSGHRPGQDYMDD